MVQRCGVLRDSCPCACAGALPVCGWAGGVVWGSSCFGADALCSSCCCRPRSASSVLPGCLLGAQGCCADHSAAPCKAPGHCSPLRLPCLTSALAAHAVQVVLGGRCVLCSRPQPAPNSGGGAHSSTPPSHHSSCIACWLGRGVLGRCAAAPHLPTRRGSALDSGGFTVDLHLAVQCGCCARQANGYYPFAGAASFRHAGCLCQAQQARHSVL